MFLAAFWVGWMESLQPKTYTGWAKKSDTSRTLHYIVRELSLFWPTLYLSSLF